MIYTSTHLNTLPFNFFFLLKQYIVSIFLSIILRTGFHWIFFLPVLPFYEADPQSSWLDVAVPHLWLGCGESGVSMRPTHSLVVPQHIAILSGHLDSPWSAQLFHPFSPRHPRLLTLVGGCSLLQCICQALLGMRDMEEKNASQVSFFIMLRSHSPEYNCQLSIFCSVANNPSAYSSLPPLPSDTPWCDLEQGLGYSVHVVREGRISASRSGTTY